MQWMSDLTHTFTVDATPEEVYDAVVDVRSWWGAINIVGPTDQLGADWFADKGEWIGTTARFDIVPTAPRQRWPSPTRGSRQPMSASRCGTMRTREEDQAAVRQHAAGRP